MNTEFSLRFARRLGKYRDRDAWILLAKPAYQRQKDQFISGISKTIVPRDYDRHRRIASRVMPMTVPKRKPFTLRHIARYSGECKWQKVFTMDIGPTIPM